MPASLDPDRGRSRRRQQYRRPGSEASMVGHSQEMSQIGSRQGRPRVYDAPSRDCGHVPSSFSCRPSHAPGSQNQLQNQRFGLSTLSGVDVEYRRTPRTETPAAEAGPLSFHVRWPAIAQFDRALRECDILEVPTPTHIHLRAGDDSAGRDTRGAASLCGTGSGDLRLAVQRHAKALVGHGERGDRGRRRTRG